MFAAKAVDRGFEPRSCQTKDHKIGMCCFSAKYVILRRKVYNSIGGIMVSVLDSSVVDRVFQPRSGQNKDHNIGICCFSVALKRQSKELVGSEKRDYVSELGDTFIRGLLFQ